MRYWADFATRSVHPISYSYLTTPTAIKPKNYKEKANRMVGLQILFAYLAQFPADETPDDNVFTDCGDLFEQEFPNRDLIIPDVGLA